MSGKWMFRLWMVVGVFSAAVFSATWSATEAAPWDNLLSLKSVDANPDKAYPVSEENGPWMVMACTFSGDGAEKQAKDLAYELRKRYKLPAYTFQGRFDPGEAQGRRLDKFGNPRKANYYKYKDEKDKEKARHPELVEIVVLVGNYRSADDEDAQATLKTLKYATPQCLEVKEGQATHQTLTGWRLAQKQVYEMLGSEKKKLGPMRHSFVTTNPLLPPEYFNQKGIDKEIIALNRGVPHSLLDCPGKYTVQVATFRGRAVIRQEEVRDIQEDRKTMGSQLAIAAKKADTLTAALRIKGYDAYQYHDRFTSIVTVGSFKSAGTPQPNGQIDLDPEIQQIIKAFRAGVPDPRDRANPAYQASLSAASAQGLDKQSMSVAPKSIEVAEGEFIPFDVQPIVVQVPKRSFSMAFGGRE